MAGISTNGLPVLGTLPAPAVVPQTALVCVDLQLPGGGTPQSIAVPFYGFSAGGAQITLLDAATINTDLSTGRLFSVTLAGNRTLANPSNPVPGQTYTWVVQQDATGSRTLAYGNQFKFPGGAPTLSTAANAIDVITATWDAQRSIYIAGIAKALA